MADRSWRPPARRAGFSRRAQYGLFIGQIIAVAGVLAGLGLVGIAATSPRAFALIRGGALDLTAPVSAAGRGVVRGVDGWAGGIGDYLRAASENAALRDELAAARRRLVAARYVELENARLKRLMRIAEVAPAPIVAARVIGSTAASSRRFATISAGSAAGVRPGQPVRGPDGLIGRVAETGMFAARVLLLTDPASMVPVRLGRGGIAALAAGRGDGMVELRPLGAGGNPFRRGDIAFTSGTGGVFAPGVPVAVVLRVESDIAVAAPLADPATLDFAIVAPESAPELEPAPPAAAPKRRR